jgi:hypothetical protein
MPERRFVQFEAFSLPALYFRETKMTNRSSQSRPATLANIAGKLGDVFSATLQRLYAAHVEKVQMRFAPLPVRSDRGLENRIYFD